LAYSGQRPGETDDHYTGSQGPQWTAMLGKQKKNNFKFFK